MKYRILFVSCLLLFVAVVTRFIVTTSARQDQAALIQAKISPWLLTHSKPGKEIEALVILGDQANLSKAQQLGTKADKARFVHNELLRKATLTQKDLLQWLADNAIEHRSYYIVNAVWVRTTPENLRQIAERQDVERIDANPTIKNNFEPKLSEEEIAEAAAAVVRARRTPQSVLAVEPGITYTRAHEVWNAGFTGQGIVIAGADTGIKWDHPALKSHYRGWDGTNATHDYNWHDSIHNSSNNICGNDTTAPCDDDNHGTHTVGTVLGKDDSSTNQIGMAPGAKFIGCRNMDNGNGTPARYIECMEWFLAPYPIGGTVAQGDPSKAPDITTNSWGCPSSEGCSANTLKAAVDAQRAAGIFMVVAAGNDGPNCSTTFDPPSFYETSYSVGAHSSSNGAIASFSSRGPATADNSNRMKPDITAPGVSVRSALRNGGYGSLSGTSMATPHVVGAIALLWSAVPSLNGQIETTINILNTAAVDVPVTSCSSSGVPNNVYGWGRMDIKAAVDLAQSTVTLANNSRLLNFPTQAFTFDVTAAPGVPWTAVSNVPWLSLTGGTSGSGNGTVTALAQANPDAPRTGTISVSDKTFTVTQKRHKNASTVGILRPSNNNFYLRQQNTTGVADLQFAFGQPGAMPIIGDWDGDGVDSIGVFNNGVFSLRNLNNAGVADLTISFGLAGDIPVAGDWNGDGVDTIGVYRNGVFYLRNSNTAGNPDLIVAFGATSDQPVTGDWDGDGIDTVGVYRSSAAIFFLRNSNTTGFADIAFPYGATGDVPVAGDWNGDGTDTVGIKRNNSFYLRNSNTIGVADVSFVYGGSSDLPLAGDWDYLP